MSDNRPEESLAKRAVSKVIPKDGIEFFLGLPFGLVGGIGQPPCITWSMNKKRRQLNERIKMTAEDIEKARARAGAVNKSALFKTNITLSDQTLVLKN